MLRVENISKKFEDRKEYAVSGVSFNLNPGEVMSIIGESGSGKTTLLRCLTGLHDLDEGKVYMNDEVVKGPKLKLVPGHPNIEMVFQDYELMPYHTVYENVRYKLIQYPDDYQKERTLDVLKICKIEDLKDKLPGNLSGGQQQRIALARAIANEPDLILLDEPFSNLDNILRKDFRKLIREIVSTINTSFIFVSHDTPDALALSDKIAIMHKGKFVQLGTPREVYDSPNSVYSAMFFGNPNVLTSSELKSLFDIDIKANKSAIRPEKISLGEGVFNGSITDINYFGSYFEYEISTAEGIILQAESHKEFDIGQELNFSVIEKDITPLND